MSTKPAGTGFAWVEDGSEEALDLALEKLRAAFAEAEREIEAAKGLVVAERKRADDLRAALASKPSPRRKRGGKLETP